MTHFRLFTLHLLVHGQSPYRQTAYMGHVNRALAWLFKKGYIAPTENDATAGWQVTPEGRAAHDSDPGLYL